MAVRTGGESAPGGKGRRGGRCDLVRGVSWAGPGGVFWAPAADDLVVTMVCQGGETVILGALPETRPALAPGELCLKSGGAEVFLRRDGHIELRGNVNVEGALTVNGDPVMVLA